MRASWITEEKRPFDFQTVPWLEKKSQTWVNAFKMLSGIVALPSKMVIRNVSSPVISYYDHHTKGSNIVSSTWENLLDSVLFNL